jgi:hypothetical protein
MKAIYKFSQEAYYAMLEGIFVEDTRTVAKWKSHKWKVHEQTGKYSEDEIDLDNLKLVSKNPVDIAMFEKLKIQSVGFNPFEHLPDDESDE